MKHLVLILIIIHWIPTTPEGIGNLAAKTVIEARINDGSNQTGNMTGSNGKSLF